MKQREFGADVLRVTATFFIIAVHFYLHNGFYYEKQSGASMLLADTARWLFFSCVPLFAMLTGYLKCHAVLSKEYYRGIVPILVTFVMASVLCVAFKILYLHQQKTAVEWLAEFLNYKAANYAWYIEMYISLFLLCPLINTVFLCEKKYHTAALVTAVCLTFLPSLGNGIMVGEVKLDFVPNYIVVWPVAYYIIGAYLRIYQPRFPKLLLALLAVLLCFGKGMMSYVTSNGGGFYDGVGGGYSDYFVAVITVTLFLLLYQIDTKSGRLRRILAHISVRCLIIYLISAIFDSILQPVLQPYTSPETYGWVFWAHTLPVFGLSLLAGEVLYPLVRLLSGGKKS